MDAIINLNDSIQNITLSDIPQATTIDNNSLLQVNATVIVGIFIFLTLQHLSKEQGRAWMFLTSFLVIPFAVSALAILVEDYWSEEYIVKWIQRQLSIPMWGAIAGFGYIILVFGYFLFRLSRRPTNARTSTTT